MQTTMVWVVCWRRRGCIPTLPIVGPLHTGGGRPPAAFYLSHVRGRGGWVWTPKPERARAFRSRSGAERARVDANAVTSSAVCCVAAHTLQAHLLNANGKDE